jgi:cellulose biosynthesis protein BcsQ
MHVAIQQFCPNPECNKRLSIADNLLGKIVRCSNCQKTFAVQLKQTAPADNAIRQVLVPSRPVGVPRVFISHSHQDRAFVRNEIQPLFNAHHIDTWYSDANIYAGIDWEDAILSGLNDSDWVLVVMSPRAVLSEWVHKETALAFDSRPERIIPVLMETCDRAKIHPRLEQIQHADFTTAQNKDAGKKKILGAMVIQLTKEHTKSQQQAIAQNELMESLRAEMSKVDQRAQGLVEKVESALRFDGQWTDPRAFASIPQFKPAGDRNVPIISVLNLKGGVGKTTLTANLAASWWGPAHGKRVLVIDLDFQASLTSLCLDDNKVNKIRAQKGFVNQVLDQEDPSPLVLLKCAYQIQDAKCPRHQAEIVPADEDLAFTESKLLARWLLEHGPMDPRCVLRRVLHDPQVYQRYDLVLLDCPPRLTATTVNGLMASDFVLIPTLLTELSINAVPRLLNWLKKLKPTLFPKLNVLGVIVNKTRETALQSQEKNDWDTLSQFVADAGNGCVPLFDTYVPLFSAAATDLKFPAHHSKIRPTFLKLVGQIEAQIRKYEPAKASLARSSPAGRQVAPARK